MKKNLPSTFLNSAFCVLRSAFLLLLTGCVYWTPNSYRTSPSATVIPNVPMQKWDIKSCGAGSLSAVLQHHGDEMTMDEWQEKLPKTRGGVMSIDLVLAARQRGFDARLVTGDRATIENELRAGRPLIMMMKVVGAPGKSYDFFHYIVLDGLDEQHRLVRTQFGDGRARWVYFEKLEGAWDDAGKATILIRPKDPAADALRAAVRLEEQGNYLGAAAEYRTILDAHPDSVIAWTNLGNAQMQLSLDDDAEQSYRKALALDSTARDAMNNLAWLLYRRKSLAEAESLARAALAQRGADSWLVLDTLGRILAAKGACGEAVTTLEKALADVPSTRAASRDDIAAALAETKTGCSAAGAATAGR